MENKLNPTEMNKNVRIVVLVHIVLALNKLISHFLLISHFFVEERKNINCYTHSLIHPHTSI